ncbi:OmpA family protein [uncultured Treponema sp.]|uniref:OmpA family protein n=1 Tax=uncultured Treponema sp. TaxID=162155 RepID=UPI0025FAFD05|nr:OmpA family protein [uncultured Treponema sp.]
MKQRIIIFITAFVILPIFKLPLFSESSGGGHSFFAGLHGDFTLPGICGLDKTFGLGWGLDAEAGLYIQNFSLGLTAGRSQVDDEGSLVKTMQETKFGVEAGYTFDKTVISFMPYWLGLRPNVSVLLDLYESEGYRSESKKLIGLKETSKGTSIAFEGGLFADFINLIHSETFSLIPVLGYKETVRLEDDGPVLSGNLSLGFRLTYTPPPPVDYDEWLAGLSGGSLVVKAPTRSKTFSPDGDGVDDIVVFDVSSDADEHGGVATWELRVYDPGNNLFWSQKGKGEVPAGFTWTGESIKGDPVESGCLYQYVWYIKAKDNADGFIPGLISTGIMIKENDGILSFSLSSIQFGPNSAEFDNISAEQAQRNHELFDAVAEILKRYSDYDVTIEGHANNVSGTEREHIKELLPLSQARAETVKRELIARGIDGERITAVGRGSEAMVSTKKEDWWKNRRVEFHMSRKGR